MDEIVVVGKNNELIANQEYMEKFLILKDAVKQFKEVDEKVRGAFLEKMLEYDIKSVETDTYIATLKESKNATYHLDEKKVLETFERFGIDPKPYMKETLRSAYVQIVPKG